MPSYNRAIMIGRLTRDPEVRTTTGGLEVASFSIAVDRFSSQSGETQTDFFKVTAWRQTAQYVSNYLNKGRLVIVDGRLQQRKWVGQDGTQRQDVEIVAERVQALDKPKDGGAGGGSIEFDAGTTDDFTPSESMLEDTDPFASE